MELTSSVDLVVIVQMIVAVFLPVLVGLVTARVTAPGTKAVILAGLAVISTLLASLIAAASAGVPFDIGIAVVAAIGTFTVAVASHYGLWKPSGTSAAVQEVKATTLVGRHSFAA